MNQHGNASVYQKYVTPDGFKLGSWASDQRKNNSKNLLSQDRIDRLETLTGWSWDHLTEQWEEAFEQLQSYLKQHGNARIPKNYVTPDGFKPERWVLTQRNNKSKNLLSQDRIERLEALAGWSWDPFTEKWENAFEQLQLYVSQHGHASFSSNYVAPDGFTLGRWVSNQRNNKSKNLLSQDRIDCLEALPGWSWDRLTEQWEVAFEQLQSYVNQHGNARVPNNYVTPDSFNLGTWVGTQRRNKSKNLLSQDRIERLESLPGWVWSFKKETD